MAATHDRGAAHAPLHVDPLGHTSENDPNAHKIVSRFTPTLPANNDLEYRGLVLENGLRVLLVNNPKEKEVGSAALSVARGHMSDPPETPGMAHFCEHMLFLGNENYPEEGEYKRYLKEHGGGANAATGPNTTVYHFHVVGEYFEGALDRFRNFFIAPLFTEDATLREMNAIESEYQRDRLSDSKRAYYLLKHMSNPAHAFGKFGTGNLTSLLHIPKEKGVDTRAFLQQFYKENYSADIMSLVVRSHRGLDVMQRWVTEGFTPIPSRGLQKQIEWPGRPFLKEHLQYVARYKPIGDVCKMSVKVPMTRVDPDYNKRSTPIVTHLLGHEGKGSLCDALREHAWITELCSGETVRDNFGWFSVEFVLTKEGEAHMFEIISELFHYVRALESSMPELRRIHDEQVRCNRLRFDNAAQLPAKNTSVLARTLRECADPTHCLSYGKLHECFDEGEILAYLHDFTPENILILASCPTPEEFAELRTEPWWGIEFSKRRFTDEETARLRSPQRFTYAMPPPNEFIPSHTNVHPPPKDNRNPVITYGGDPHTQAPSVTTWWKHDGRFLTPKMHVHARLETPAIKQTVLGQVASDLFVDAVHVLITKTYYDADICGNWSFSCTPTAFALAVGGFADKTPQLFLRILKDALSVRIEEPVFAMVKEQAVRKIQSRKMLTPRSLILTSVKEAMCPELATTADFDRLTEDITYSEFLRFIVEFKESLKLEMLAYGNVEEATSTQLGEQSRAILREVRCGLKPRDVTRIRLVDLPRPAAGKPFEHHLVQYSPNPTNINSCILIHHQLGLISFRTRALVNVLEQIISPRFFTELRTKQQLGYSVSAGMHIQGNTINFRFQIQSTVQPPSELHKRVDAFLEEFGGILEGISDADFETVKQSSIQKALEPTSNLPEEFTRLKAQLWDRSGCWNSFE
eukprot:gene21121-32538_t